MSRIWPADVLREFLARAELTGVAEAVLETQEDAERFRFALYPFRRTHKIGQNLRITINGTSVLAHKRPEPKIALVSQENYDELAQL